MDARAGYSSTAVFCSGLAPVVVPFERRAEYLAMLADGDSDGLAEMFRSFSHSEEERIAAFAEAAQE